MAMTDFRTSSINKQISVVFMLVLFISLIVSGTAFVFFEYLNKKSDFADQLTAVANITASRSSAALQFDDKETLLNILESLDDIDSIELTCAYQYDDQLLASYKTNIESKCPDVLESEGIYYNQQSIQIILPSKRDELAVGTIYIQASLAELYQRLLISILIMMTVTVVTSFIAYQFLRRSQKVITEPVMNLTAIADRIASNKDYYFPEIPICAQEITTMYLAFENMLGKIKDKEDELVRSETRLQEILDHSLLSISIKDLEGKFTYYNQYFQDLLLKSQGDEQRYKRLGIGDLLKKDEASVHEDRDKWVLENSKSVKYETDIMLDDGIHNFQIVKIPLHDDEKNIYAICTMATDITDAKQQAELLKRSQKMDALGKLTGGIAHDYNNMLAVIIGYAQLVESASKEYPKIRTYAQEIKKAGNRGAKLTSKLLAFSRTKPAEARDTSVTELVNGAKLMLEKTLTARIQLNLSLSDDIWLVKLDQDDLEDAILNICINAMHAIEETGNMAISTNNCRFSKEQAEKLNMAAGDYIVIKITDSGTGMSKDVLSHIFDPFFSTKGEKGTGLGLSQVYGFVQRSDGHINVESEVGKGTEFFIYFPRSIQANANDDKSRVEDERDYYGTESILVVDDEEALANLASEILRRAGYQVVSVENAEQALNVMKLESFDLLFSDVIMPGISGYVLASEVRKKYPLTKIQLVSGYNSNIPTSQEDSLLKKQMMNKPYGNMKLLRTIRTLLDQ